jgi:hypothetical protein
LFAPTFREKSGGALADVYFSYGDYVTGDKLILMQDLSDCMHSCQNFTVAPQFVVFILIK